jgi:hypothetical protein
VTDPFFLTVEDVEEVHADSLERFDMAAAYAFHIAESQPFVDGARASAPRWCS